MDWRALSVPSSSLSKIKAHKRLHKKNYRETNCHSLTTNTTNLLHDSEIIRDSLFPLRKYHVNFSLLCGIFLLNHFEFHLQSSSIDITIRRIRLCQINISSSKFIDEDTKTVNQLHQHIKKLFKNTPSPKQNYNRLIAHEIFGFLLARHFAYEAITMINTKLEEDIQESLANE